MAGTLEHYRKKRNFDRTPEPRAGRAARGDGRQFVIQKHDARRLHYDFRLEHNGVLKSWAVPKEPTPDPKARRLAVRTEDHPLAYAAFEGEIPPRQYGAGSVVIWDRGSWSPLSDPERGLAEGKLDFELHGERLAGRWTLVRMAEKGSRKDGENWLLIKRSDTSRRSAPKASRTATSRRTLGDLGRKRGAKRTSLPQTLMPQLATLVARPPSGNGWLFEPKLDGYRLLCRIEDGHVRLQTRSGKDWSARFPTIRDAASSLPCKSAVIDGEAVVFDEQGLTRFQSLQNAIASGDSEIVLVAFDLLFANGYDLRSLPLGERKALLRTLLEDSPLAIRYGEHVEQSGDAFFAEACRLRLEGIIAKRADDAYRAGRTSSWLKIKCLQRQEFVIVGFTAPGGSRTGFGALLLGVHDAASSTLRYTGKVGTGFDERTLRMLTKRLEKLRTEQIPVSDVDRAVQRQARWVEPKLVAEISFSEWTADRRLRHPVYQGLREDKPAKEVVAERPALVAQEPTRRVRLTNPDKVLYPDLGITKRQLAEYWERVAEHALPLLLHRPLTLVRCPNGHAKECFYQKHAGAAVPEQVARIDVGDGDPYLMVDSVEALRGLAQIGTLEVHVWGSRASDLERPDLIVFDLDPAEDLRWKAVVDAAHGLNARLEALGLRSFLRLTGGKGLHLVVPIVPQAEWSAIKKFARAVVDEMVRDEPSRFTASMAKRERTGKIFVDYLRNERGSTAIASYSPRARKGAPVALPIAWDELDAKARKAPRFSLPEVPELLKARNTDPWAELEHSRRALIDG